MHKAKLWQEPPVKIPRGFEGLTLAAQLVQVGYEEYLEIDIFMDERRVYRYFAQNSEYGATWCARDMEGGPWNTRKLSSLIVSACPNMTMWQCYNLNQYFAHKEDERLVLDYLGTYSVDSFENRVAGDKYMAKIRRKAARVDAVMDRVPVLTEEMHRWTDEVIFSGHYMIKDKETGSFLCTACGYKSKEKLKHGRVYTCPGCGEQIKVESRLERKNAMAPIIVLQTMGDREYVERQFVGICEWSRGKKTIELQERVRAVIPAGKQWGKLYYGQYENGDEFSQDWWTSNPRSQHFRKSYLYPGNLPEVLEMAGLSRSGLDVAAELGEKLDVNLWIIEAKSRPYLEYMVKAGLVRLACDIISNYYIGSTNMPIDSNARKLKDVLMLDGNRAARMKTLNGSTAMLRWLHYEQRRGLHISTESLTYLDKRGIIPADCLDILTACGSVERMANYLRKQGGKGTLGIWADYIRMAEQEGMNTTDDIVRFPKELKRRHDELVDIRTQRAKEEKDKKNAETYRPLDEKIRKRLPEVRYLFYDSEKYMIIPAGTCMELVTEGRALHHCVGASTRYMEKMAKGESWICFLRKKEELEKAYYTLEVDLETGRIIQWYSEYDRKPDQEKIAAILEIYKKGLKKAA